MIQTTPRSEMDGALCLIYISAWTASCVQPEVATHRQSLSYALLLYCSGQSPCAVRRTPTSCRRVCTMATAYTMIRYLSMIEKPTSCCFSIRAFICKAHECLRSASLRGALPVRKVTTNFLLYYKLTQHKAWSLQSLSHLL